MSQRNTLLLGLFAFLPVALLVGCSGGGSGSGASAFTQCGNGRIDSGETCDDGNTDDTDDCVSTCVPARCGDGVVHIGVEDCDGFNLNHTGCNTLNRVDPLIKGSTALRCTTSCEFDTSLCGATFTPTDTPTERPTPSETPTQGGSTPTPTPSPTPTPNLCGDGLLESDEVCDVCPTPDPTPQPADICRVCAADCTVSTCTAASPIQTVQVSFDVPPGGVISLTQVLVGYRGSFVSLPGSGSDPRARVKNRPEGTSQLVNDLDYALRVTVSELMSGSFLSSGPLFTVDFDSCDGALPASPSDFSCRVTQCASSFGDVAGCSCTVTATSP